MDRAVFDEYYPKIYNYIYYRVLHRETAEDLTGEVFYKAAAFAASFDARKASYKTWLFSIAHNIVANHWRGKKDDVPLDSLDFAAESGVEELLMIKEDIRRLRGFLMSLTEKERRVLALRFWGELSHKEIASRMDLPVNTVSSILKRSVEKMKKMW